MNRRRADDDPRPVGELLREWRERKGISQREAAELVAVKQATWCRWETGVSLPSTDVLTKIVAALDGEVTASGLMRAASIRVAS